MKKIKLIIQGMHCSSCIEVIKINLDNKAKSFKSNVLTGLTEIEFDEKNSSEKEIKEIIIKSGYKVK